MLSPSVTVVMAFLLCSATVLLPRSSKAPKSISGLRSLLRLLVRPVRALVRPCGSCSLPEPLVYSWARLTGCVGGGVLTLVVWCPTFLPVKELRVFHEVDCLGTARSGASCYLCGRVPRDLAGGSLGTAALQRAEAAQFDSMQVLFVLESARN